MPPRILFTAKIDETVEAAKKTDEEKLLEEANAAKSEKLVKAHPVTNDDAKLNEIP